MFAYSNLTPPIRGFSEHSCAFRGELARQSRGIDQITEQDGELAAFGVCAQRDGVERVRPLGCLYTVDGSQKKAGSPESVRDAVSTRRAQTLRGCITSACADCIQQRPSQSTGAHHVPTYTRCQTTRESQHAPPLKSPGALKVTAAKHSKP